MKKAPNVLCPGPARDLRGSGVCHAELVLSRARESVRTRGRTLGLGTEEVRMPLCLLCVATSSLRVSNPLGGIPPRQVNFFGGPFELSHCPRRPTVILPTPQNLSNRPP